MKSLAIRQLIGHIIRFLGIISLIAIASGLSIQFKPQTNAFDMSQDENKKTAATNLTTKNTHTFLN